MNKLNTWALVPKLRFPEFLGDGGWKKNFLGNCCTIRTGKLDANAMVSNGKYRFYTCAKNYYLIDKYAFNTDALLISGNGANVGYIHHYHGKFNAYQRTYVLNKFSESIIFIKYYLETTLHKRINSEKKEGNTPYIVISTLTEMMIKLPTREGEQQKIADCLSSIDDLITAQSQKLTTLKTHKKGLMQQLFPNQNQTTPTLRFPEFLETGNWLNILLGKLYSFKRTNSLSRNKLNYKEGLVKNIHYGDIHTKFSTLLDIKKEIIPFINTSQSLEKIKLDNYCIEGDIIFADASEDLDDVGKSIEIINLNNEGLLSGLHTLLARQNKSKLIVGFGGHLFKSYKIRLQIKKEAQGTKVLGISAKRLNNIKICFPQNKQEQQKIADCLSSLDDLITTQNQKLAVLKTHKKGLMQQLFPINEGAV